MTDPRTQATRIQTRHRDGIEQVDGERLGLLRRIILFIVGLFNVIYGPDGDLQGRGAHGRRAEE